MPDVALPTIRSFFPQSEVRDIDCGHWIISEQPELFKKGMDVAVTLQGYTSVLTQLVVVDFISHHQASEAP